MTAAPVSWVARASREARRTGRPVREVVAGWRRAPTASEAAELQELLRATRALGARGEGRTG
jgi:hypothetical protein